MFDDLLRELRHLEKPQQIRVSMPSDEEGYFDRECPSPECLFAFKVHEDDWRDKVRDEEVFWPFCGHTADSRKWLTQDQLEHAKKAAIAHMRQRIGHAMKRNAEINNRPQPVLLPAAAAESMRLKITCPACSCRYAVIGAAFFCPACGHNSAELLFSQSILTIRNAVAALRSGDTSYRIGQRVVIRDAAVHECLLLIEKLAVGMAADVRGTAGL